MSGLGGFAIEYATIGYEVLALSGKVPFGGSHGVLDATRNPATIRQWWQRWPDANVGARVPSHLLVLDVDPRSGGDESLAAIEQEYGPLPPTRTTISGRNDGGRHAWFRHGGGRVTAARLGAGLDLKTHTGYVVLPPSLHPATGKPYTWQAPPRSPAPAPSWLHRLIRPPLPRTPVPTGNGDGHELAAWLATQREGNRNAGLYWTLRRAIEAGYTDSILTELAAVACGLGLSDREVAATVASARRWA